MTREAFRGRDPQWEKHERKHLANEVRDHKESRTALIRDAQIYILTRAKKDLEEYIFHSESQVPEKKRALVLSHALEVLSEFCRGIIPDREENTYTPLLGELVKRTGYSEMILSGVVESMMSYIQKYDDLVNLRARSIPFEVRSGEGKQLFRCDILLQPEYRDGTFLLKEVRNDPSLGTFPYNKAPVDPLFFKNVFGLEIGSAYPLDFSFSMNTKKDDGNIEYELNVQRARDTLYQDVFSGAIQSHDEMHAHYPKLAKERAEDVFAQARKDRTEFIEASKKNLAKGIEYFRSHLASAKSKFVGVRVQRFQQYGESGEKPHGFFHEGSDGLEALLAQYPDTIAWPVYGDDIFSLKNDYVHRAWQDFYLGKNYIGREESFPDENRTDRSIFKMFVTEDDFKEFWRVVHEMHDKKFRDVKHTLPADVKKLIRDGRIILRDPESEFSPQRTHDMILKEVFDNIYTYHQFVAYQDPRSGELGETFEKAQQDQLKNYLREQDTSILVDVVIRFFFQPNTAYIPLLLNVLFERSRGLSGGFGELFRTFQRKVSQERWIHLRRALWAETSDPEFLKSTLGPILASGNEGLGEAAGTVSEFDLYKKEWRQENYQWGKGDVIAILDRLNVLADTHEQPVSPSEAQAAIVQLIDNRHNMNEAIARFIPFVKDSTFLRSLIARWSRDASDPRFRDAPRRIAPFASVPCIVLAYGKERIAHSILADESYSYETRLFALSRVSAVKRSELIWAGRLLLQPNIHNHGQSELRVETINRGLLDAHPEVLQKIFTLSAQSDINVQKAAERRLKSL